MDTKSRMISFLPLVCFVFSFSLEATSPVGKKNKIPFAKSLPEDISNENFPDVIESFDYPDANIIDLIRAIGKLTGLNFIVDPAISNKKITIVAPSQITVSEAYKAFLSALAINGYTVVKSGAFWKIQETKKALKDNTEIYSNGYFPNTDQLITRIIKLKYIDAKEFSESIKYLLSQNNQISHHKSSNSVIISDYGSVIERIMKIVYEMDIPGSEEKVEIISIQHAAASDLANILNQILSLSPSSPFGRSRTFSPLRHFNSPNRIAKTTKDKSKKTGNVKISNIISDERTNSLVISANKEGFVRVKDLIQKLDTYVDPTRTGGIYVYNVLYGTAEQVYNTLMGISPSEEPRERRQSPSSRRRTRSGGFSSFGENKSSTSPLFDNVTIMADQNTNSLIISARNKYDFERVKAVLKKIDVPKDQVFVQAVIVEMSVNKGDHWEINLTKALSKGLGKWSQFLNVNGTPLAGFLNRSFSASPNSLQGTQFGPGLVLGMPLRQILKGSGLSPSDADIQSEEIIKLIGSDEFKGLSEDLKRSALDKFRTSSTSTSIKQALNYSMFPLLQILKRVGNINILSTPQITALDNVTASIEVGENAPVGLTSTATAGTGFQNSVDRQDVTLRLEITPRINPDSKTIQMDISQKFDDFSAKQSTASELSSKGVHLIKRNIETKLVLNDGETAVLGGLLVDKEVQHENKVPVLGDLPVVGWLFKGSTVEKEKKNLLVFITPTIIQGKEQTQQTKKLLGKKLEERIDFIKKHMAGRDPHGEFLGRLLPSHKKQQSFIEEPEDPLTEDNLAREDFEEENAQAINEDINPDEEIPFEEEELEEIGEEQTIEENGNGEELLEEENSTKSLDSPEIELFEEDGE